MFVVILRTLNRYFSINISNSHFVGIIALRIMHLALILEKAYERPYLEIQVVQVVILED